MKFLFLILFLLLFGNVAFATPYCYGEFSLPEDFGTLVQIGKSNYSFITSNFTSDIVNIEFNGENKFLHVGDSFLEESGLVEVYVKDIRFKDEVGFVSLCVIKNCDVGSLFTEKRGETKIINGIELFIEPVEIYSPDSLVMTKLRINDEILFVQKDVPAYTNDFVFVYTDYSDAYNQKHIELCIGSKEVNVFYPDGYVFNMDLDFLDSVSEVKTSEVVCSLKECFYIHFLLKLQSWIYTILLLN